MVKFRYFVFGSCCPVRVCVTVSVGCSVRQTVTVVVAVVGNYCLVRLPVIVAQECHFVKQFVTDLATYSIKDPVSAEDPCVKLAVTADAVDASCYSVK